MENIIETIKQINILAILHRIKIRRGLKNRNVSFLCPNCIGGMLFHDLGLQFRSPTINLMIRQKDFLKFVLDLEHYINQKLQFYDDKDYQCPCAKLDDITIHFTHYNSEKEAEQKWNERCKRVNLKNLFIFMMEKDGLTKSDIKLLANVKARGIVVFTAHDYLDIPYALYIRKYSTQKEVGNILKINHLNESKEYEKYFDFVKWFNESKGGNYNISNYKKGG